MYGKKHTEETLAKQRNKKLGKNNPMYGKPASEESNQKRRMSMTGKKIILSDEAKQKARERGRWLGNLRKKPVLCIEDGLEFESATTAAAHYGVTSSTLCGHLTGKQHTCCGKHFKYLDKNE